MSRTAHRQPETPRPPAAGRRGPRWRRRPPGGRVTPCGAPGWGSGCSWASSCSAIVGQAVPLYTDWLWFQEVGFTTSSPRACSSPAGSSSGSAPSSSSSSSSTSRWPRAPPRRTCSGSSRTSSGCPAARSSSRSSAGCSCRSSRSSRSSRGPARPARGPPCSSTSTARRSTRSDPLFGRDLGFYFFVLPFWRLLYGWAHRAGGGHARPDAPRSTCSSGASCSPRAARAWPRGPGPTCSASARCCSCVRARRLLARPLRSALLAPRGSCSARPTADVHASLPGAAVADRARGPLRGGLRRSRCSGRAGASWWPGSWCWWWCGSAGLGDRARAPAELPGQAERAGLRAALHPAQHPDDPAGLRARPRRRRRTSPPRSNLNAGGARARTTSRSRTSGSGTTGRCSPRTASSRRSAPTTSSATWTTTATRSTANIARSCSPPASCPTGTCPARAELDQRAPDLHPRVRARGGTGQPDQPGGAARVLRQGHPARGRRAASPRSPGPRSTTASPATSTCFVRTQSQELDYPSGRPERLHPLRGAGRHPGRLPPAQGWPSRRASASSRSCSLERPHVGEPRS